MVKTLYPTDDAYIWSSGSGGNGSSTSLWVGPTTGPCDYRAIIRFSVNDIPMGSHINSATLCVYYYTYYGSLAPRAVNAYRVTSNWSESTVTWNNNYDASTSASGSVGGSTTGWSNWDLTSLVQRWADGAAWNYGVMLKCPSEGSSVNNRLGLASKEYGDSNYWPQLVVDYTPPQPSPQLQPPWLSKSSVYVGETVTLQVSGKNLGPGTATYGGITTEVWQAYTDGAELSETHSAPGADSQQSVWWQWDLLGGTKTSANYLHIEPTWYNWGAQSQNTVTTTFTARKVGTYDVYSKMYLASSDGTIYRTPGGSSPLTDDQNESTVYVGRVTVQPRPADLKPTQLVLSKTTYFAEDDVQFSLSVSNLGDLDSGSYTARCYLSTSPDYSAGNDIFLCDIPMPSMASGPLVFGRKVRLPYTLAGGVPFDGSSYYLTVFLNPDRTVTEGDYNNNIVYSTSALTVKGASVAYEVIDGAATDTYFDSGGGVITNYWRDGTSGFAASSVGGSEAAFAFSHSGKIVKFCQYNMFYIPSPPTKYALHFDGAKKYNNANENCWWALKYPTRYDSSRSDPILFVHGIGTADYGDVDYWNGIPDSLAQLADYSQVWQMLYPQRESVSQATVWLGQAVQEILNKHPGASKVQIICHSAGGLITRNLVQSDTISGNDNIGSILFLAPVSHGSHQAVRRCNFEPYPGLMDNPVWWCLYYGHYSDEPMVRDLATGNDLFRTLNASKSKLTQKVDVTKMAVVSGDITTIGLDAQPAVLVEGSPTQFPSLNDGGTNSDGYVSIAGTSLLDLGIPLYIADGHHGSFTNAHEAGINCSNWDGQPTTMAYIIADWLTYNAIGIGGHIIKKFTQESTDPARFALKGNLMMRYSGTDRLDNKLPLWEFRLRNSSGTLMPGRLFSTTSRAIEVGGDVTPLYYEQNSFYFDDYNDPYNENPAGASAEGLSLSADTYYLYDSSGRVLNAGPFVISFGQTSYYTVSDADLTPMLPPAITQQPHSQTIGVAQTVTFSVSATSTAPIQYQWQRNGSNISGATGTSYSIPTVGLIDDGAQFRCIVSNRAGATTSSIATLTVVAVPSAPSGLTATAASSNQINLSWTDNSNNESGFKIESKIGASGTYTQIATASAGATTYSHTGLSASTQYYYRVRATNIAGDSVNSNEASATTLAAWPSIGVSSSSIAASCEQGTNAAAQSFEVWNSGDGTLTYSVSDDAAWLSCSPTSGTSTGEHDTIGISYSTSGLAAGNYSATITISATGATNSPRTISVSLTVNAGTSQPDLIVESVAHSPEPSATGSTVTFTVTVRNGGGGNAGLFNVGFWSNLSSAPTISSSPEQMQDIYDLAAGASTQLTFTATAPANGNYTAWAYVDRWNGTSEVTESNENNNAGPVGGHGWAVRPANDNFVNRINLTGVTATATGTNVNATEEGGESNHDAQPTSTSVWWSWTAPYSGGFEMNTFGSSFDTVLAVYTGSAVSALTWVASNDDYNGPGHAAPSQVSFNAVAGTQYAIAVDGWGGLTGSISLQIKPLSPVITSSTSANAQEYTAFTYQIVATNSPMSYAATGLPMGVSINPTTGAITGTPTVPGTTNATISATNAGGTGSATLTITVAPVNAPPIAISQSVSGIEDTPVNISLTGNDGDNEVAQTLTFAIAILPNHGVVSGLNPATGSVTYIPNPNYNGTDSFSFTATDDGTAGSPANLTSVPAVVSITVTPVNDSPTFTKGPNQVVMDDSGAQAVANWATSISPGPADESAQTVNFVVSNDNNALFSVQPVVTASGMLTYTPAPNAFGVANVMVSIRDNGGTASGGVDTSTQTFTITVSPVNDAPVAYGQAVSLNEDTSLNITLTGSDVEGSALTFSITSGPAHGTLGPISQLTSASAQVTYTASSNYNGSDNFQFRTNDGTLNSAVATVSISIDAINDPPTISDIPNQTINEDTNTGAISFTIGDVETAAASLTISGTSNNATLVPNGNIVFGGSGANRTVTATPALNQSGTATITVTVSDGSATASDSFTLTVNAVNDPPTISAIPNQIVSVNGSTGTIPFTVADVETSPNSLVVSVSSISNPTLVPPGNITFSGTGANRTITVVPSTNMFGSSIITVTVSDGSLSAYTSFSVSVNNPPTISDIANVLINEDTSTGALAFTVGDAETAPESLTVSGISSNTTLVPNGNILFGGTGVNRTVNITPAPNQNGTCTITLTVSDGSATASKAFPLTVIAVNDSPTISHIPNQIIDEDTSTGALAFTIADVETATSLLAVSGTSSNTTLVPNGNIVLGGSGANRTVTVTPASNQNGAATITVTVSDGSATASDSFVLTVNAVNDAPSFTKGANQFVLEDCGARIVPGWATNISVGPANESGQAANFIVTNDNIGMFAAQPAIASDGTLTYTPATKAHGSATVTVRIHDNGGTVNGGVDTSSLQTFKITVNAPPVASIAAAPLSGVNTLTVNFDGSASSDVDGTITAFAWSFGDGTTGTGAALSHTYAPGAFTAKLTVTDNDGATGTASVTIDVAAVAPAITSALSATAMKGSPFSYTITAFGSTPMTFEAADLPAGLSLSGDTISGTPTVGGVVPVTLKATNIAGADIKTMQLTIARPFGTANNAPTISSAPTASPNTGTTGHAVTFIAAATDADGDMLGYTWDFGDGTIGAGASPLHTYGAPGIYTVTVSVLDGTTITTQEVNYLVSAAEVPIGDDNGGDSSWNTAPLDVFAIQKASVKLNFTRGTKDTLQLSGALPVAKFFKPLGKKVTVLIGGFKKDFTLNAKGQGTSGGCKFQMKGKMKKGVFKATPAKFTLTVKGEPLLAALTECGFANKTTSKTGEHVDMTAIIMVDTLGYEARKTVLYKATAGKSGSAK